MDNVIQLEPGQTEEEWATDMIFDCYVTARQQGQEIDAASVLAVCPEGERERLGEAIQGFEWIWGAPGPADPVSPALVSRTAARLRSLRREKFLRAGPLPRDLSNDCPAPSGNRPSGAGE